MRRKLSHRSDRAGSYHSTTSSQGSRARLVIKTRQGSEVIDQTVRNNMGTTVMPWAAAGIIPIDNIESVFPTHKDTRFDIAVSSNIGNKTYQWKCKTKLQRDLWVEAIALVHEQLQKSNMVVTMVDNVEDGEDGEDGEYDEDYDKQSGRSEVERDNNELNKTNVPF